MPKSFLVLAAGLVSTAVGMPLQVMLAYGYMPWDLPQILARLAPLNYIVASFALFEAAAALRASPWLWLTIPAFIAVVGWNNWLVVAYGLNATPAEAWFATGAAALIHLPLLTGAARRVLLNPRLRWWLTAPRRRVQVRTTVWPVLGGEVATSTFDVSEGGAFIRADGALGVDREQTFQRLSVGKRCSLRLRLDPFRSLTCRAEVVRVAQPSGAYPGGFAVRFLDLSREDRAALVQFVAQAGAQVEEAGLARAA